MKLLWMVAGLALASATAASAANEEDNESPEEKVVCKTEKITGSRTRVKRTCMTQREWNELAAASKQGIDEMVRDSNRGAQSVPIQGATGGL